MERRRLISTLADQVSRLVSSTVMELHNLTRPTIWQWVPVPHNSKNIEAKRHNDRLNPAGRIQLSHRIFDMKIDCILADFQDLPNFP